MASAAILSLQECRDTKRRIEVWQRLHHRFTPSVDGLEVCVKASQPTVEELTYVVFARRQALTQADRSDLACERCQRGTIPLNEALELTSAPRAAPAQVCR